MTAGVDGQVLRGTSRVAAWANFVKVAHTLFALPFTVVGILLAARSYPVSWRAVLLAIAAFGAARFAAMGFNRIVDRAWDARNPRTAMRELPSGRLPVRDAWILVVVMSLVFVACAAALNPVCLVLSPVALAWVLGYSFTKRFTHFSHLWLGWGLAIAPVGGYLAIAGRWSQPWWLLLVLGGMVACWVAGFDILYALQDEDFDREQGLYSIPVLHGARGAIWLARALHILAVVLLTVFWQTSGFGHLFGLGVIAASLLLSWEHRVVNANDYSRLDAAFFMANAWLSGLVMAGALADTFLGR